MNKVVAGTVLTLPLLISGSLYPISGSRYPLPTTRVYRCDVALTSGDGADSNDALVLIPAENAEYADVANALYLAPNGFDGTATVFLTPDVGNEVQNIGPGVQALVQTIEGDYSAGDLSAADPLYVFGYSAGAVEISLAEQQLAADHIPQADLNFVMVGDSASAEGGFLNTVVSSLPESWQQPATELFALAGVTSPVLGATTPDDLYPTDVYSLTGDGWSNWDNGANLLGMFTDHLEYLGLTPTEIASATQTTDGLTDYFSIDSSGVDGLSALWNTALLGLGIIPPNATADTVAAAATPATVSTDTAEVLAQAVQALDQIPQASLDAQQLGVELGAEIFSSLGIADSLLP
ncbi:PE-PPE domain-containing protein [Candidatus Mycobacterium methanotrophicum]|uniref:PE-PPE domain-containing protein n=1 Tax=Candidatus Mycobacterium methanotrophicum TaxID=2943498 RepID=A0ABY4QPP7_9MYCO|nr:PE-PPE domain-containing protein [Candidatus Mycobacterium methanotrophicum]UQX12232.1 PE-PPE domain-containing protein [Candidatus Mycobacterium methanotrophicum]